MAASARRPDGKPASRQAAPPRKAGPSGTERQRQRGRTDGFAAQVSAFVLRNPLPLGSGTAFLVALSFVSANAIWGQTQGHAGVFFPTRALSSGWVGEAATTGGIPSAPLRPAADPTLRRVQVELGRIGLYSGALDGLPGPGTRKAIAAFQARNSLEASGELDGSLIVLLERQAYAAATGEAPDAADAIAVASNGAPAGDRGLTAKVQAGLKAFGIDGIAVDGIMGARTRAGIREFQGMFGLPETGEPDEGLLVKMRETGLAD